MPTNVYPNKSAPMGAAPIATIVDRLGTDIPPGYLPCDGQKLLRASYPDLAAVTDVNAFDHVQRTMPFGGNNARMTKIGSRIFYQDPVNAAYSDNDGLTWQDPGLVSLMPPGSAWVSLYGDGGNRGIAVSWGAPAGFVPLIDYTINGGVTWNRCTTPPPDIAAVPGGNFGPSFFCINPVSGRMLFTYRVNDLSYVAAAYSDDGGNNWVGCPHPPVFAGIHWSGTRFVCDTYSSVDGLTWTQSISSFLYDTTALQSYQPFYPFSYGRLPSLNRSTNQAFLGRTLVSNDGTVTWAKTDGQYVEIAPAQETEAIRWASIGQGYMARATTQAGKNLYTGTNILLNGAFLVTKNTRSVGHLLPTTLNGVGFTHPGFSNSFPGFYTGFESGAALPMFNCQSAIVEAASGGWLAITRSDNLTKVTEDPTSFNLPIRPGKMIKVL